MTPWDLPVSANIGGTKYKIHADFRDVLDIVKRLNDETIPEYFRWRIAIALFFDGDIPKEHYYEAMRYLSLFLSCGEKDESKPGPVLVDWEQDAKAIVSDINKIAGKEIRSVQFLHWWTFIAYFNAIGEGQLSTIVSIRNKMMRGKKLEDWEKEYYRNNKAKVDIKRRYTEEEMAARESILKFLDGQGGGQ